MKLASAAALAVVGCLVGFNSANAQGVAMKTTPTTKILAIGTINPGFDQSQVRAVLPEEVRETVELYLDGKIEQWYSLQGRPGVAFIINVTDPAVAHEMLEKLPLGKAHMMSFELIPIGPLNPLRFLQGMQSKP
ncbi:muconolactone Delta-isomerase family protein [Bradyrhizobium sp. NAS96.2]|uniref:muconolactone Delta-isomerase family protein n=1 Tax=Bradyrhizobium sp. NAS96.2 TaxID=1680160 RepID=UPI00093D5493|nr:muconolactone Delta-isomerase family protein [Bradyrhizobium sp. NAS96.2]